jgi:cytochrome P450
MIGMGLSFMVGPFRVLIPKSLKTTAWQKAHAFIEACIDTALHDQKSTQENETPSSEPSSHSVGLSLLEGLTKQTNNRVTIRSQVLQGMMAAQDTTSVLLGNTLFLLARDPNAYKRVRKEALSLDVDQSPLLFDNLKELKFISHVFNECKSKSDI